MLTRLFHLDHIFRVLSVLFIFAFFHFAVLLSFYLVAAHFPLSSSFHNFALFLIFRYFCQIFI